MVRRGKIETLAPTGKPEGDTLKASLTTQIQSSLGTPRITLGLKEGRAAQKESSSQVKNQSCSIREGDAGEKVRFSASREISASQGVAYLKKRGERWRKALILWEKNLNDRYQRMTGSGLLRIRRA